METKRYDDTCPYCDSMNVTCGEVFSKNDTNYFTVFCYDCGKEWNELVDY